MSEQNVRPVQRPHRGHGPMRGMMPGEKPKDFRRTLSRMIAFLGAFKVPLAAAVLFAIGSTVFSIVGPKVLSTATTELFSGLVAKVDGTGGINFDTIGSILLATLGLYGLSAACSFAQSWLMTGVSQRACYQLRGEIARKIDRMSTSRFDDTSTGDVLSRITNDVDVLGQSLNQGVTQLITSSVTIVGVLAMMLSINPLMTLIALGMLPISAVLVGVVVKVSQKHFVRQQNLLGKVNGLVEETFSGFEVVKAFGSEKSCEQTFEQVNERLRESAWKSQFLTGMMQPIMGFVGNLGYIAVAISGSFFAVRGIVTVGDIQAFIQYVKNFTQPITQLTQVSNMLQQMAAAAERVFEFLDEPEADGVADDVEAARIRAEGLTCDVEFDHVRFGYDSDKPVIGDFSAHIKQGQTVALVGPTGAGKTTLVKLLMRFYDVQAGAIRIGGTDIRDLPRSCVRELFGMVLQDAWLFGGTIRENIRYGNLDATDEQVELAARAAYVHRFVMTLPDGYDTVISEDAGNISQGQRQLLTIARAILANRRMLILDEATSSVDTRTEERIQKAMDNLMQGRTSFIIAHRLSTIVQADLILVINNGDIVEQGTHDELLALGGFYAQLYNSQFQGNTD
ncbi:ABC transporter ATP-binding protein [Adlercreutzia sp. ZJ138]|uniref:ABC transporter ATP-binding protein n=1 Tax=Adlercreutzia sp. ZJ138 TaxID=2709405 RepID=UPI0013ED1517|nr:ABC transporter ATP-binding protein [Adlercreutzia sp. ZJ138]